MQYVPPSEITNGQQSLLCSVICPTRNRLPLLERCVRSIINTAFDKNCFEIILRAHADDKETFAGLWPLLAHPQVKVVIGRPLGGYDDLSRFYDEAAALASGKWIWVMNDDVIVESLDWDQKILNEPTDAILMPKYHRLGGASYEQDDCTPFMFFPNECWRKYGWKRFQDPFDMGMWELLRKFNWPTRYPDIAVWHKRKSDPELKSERVPFPARCGDDNSEQHMENL